jgi:hypothetical protein
MKLLSTIAAVILSHSIFAQVFWSETFGSGCNQGQLATAFSSANGSWTVTNTGTNAGSANVWYVGATENNTGVGNCSTVCGTNATLHLGNVNVSIISADQGAAYYEGLAGFCGLLPCGSTDKRVESPAISCMGKENIAVSFTYIEGGNAIDNATVWYYDGNSWSQLADPAKTFSGICSPQGVWTNFTATLPASANDNPNVKIGFRWINNDDGDATDPSFAVDDIQFYGDDIASGECIGDFNSDGVINAADLLLFLGNFGCSSGCFADLTGDDAVNAADMLIFLGIFGTECP